MKGIKIFLKKKKNANMLVKHTEIFLKNNTKWCHVRHINPVKTHPERITREDKKLVNSLNYDGIEFPVRKKGFSKIEKKI